MVSVFFGQSADSITGRCSGQSFVVSQHSQIFNILKRFVGFSILVALRHRASVFVGSELRACLIVARQRERSCFELSDWSVRQSKRRLISHWQLRRLSSHHAHIIAGCDDRHRVCCVHIRVNPSSHVCVCPDICRGAHAYQSWNVRAKIFDMAFLIRYFRFGSYVFRLYYYSESFSFSACCLSRNELGLSAFVILRSIQQITVSF